MCLWSIIPVVGEGMAYANDSDPAHLGLMALFFCLVILTFPTNDPTFTIVKWVFPKKG